MNAHATTPRTVQAIRDAGARPSWLIAVTVLCVGVPPGGGTPGQEASGVQVTAGDVAAAGLVAVAAFLVVTRRAAMPRQAFLAFGPVTAALGVATVCSRDIAASLPGYVRGIQLFVLVPLAVVLLVRDRRDLAIVCGSVLALGLGEAGYGIWQSVTGNGASIEGEAIRAVGTFGAADVMALSVLTGFAILVLTAFALVAPRRGTAAVLACLAGLGVLAVALAFALSRGSWLALGVAAALMLVIFDRWVAVRTLVCCAALLLLAVATVGGGAQAVVARSRSIAGSVTTPDQSVSDRYNLWGAAQRIWQDHPVTGVGVKNFPAYRDTYASIELSSGSETEDPVHGYVRQPLLSPHNEYLLILSEQGVVGFTGFAVLIAVILHGLWTRRRTRDPFWLIGVGVMAFLLVNFLYADLGGPTCVLTAVLLGVAAARALGLEPSAGPARAAPSALFTRPLERR
ncbi:O-antigen ligase family protein [Actinomadura graeca]|uniref:O-antigen ligase family protein n=1 Tax=Actinomadura graeca TaxID=2750812 RepID=A0ABX8QVB9_9ACTN|nr:O-antigen ligase family protein [Actinomadura graeca]QXJ22680.1 O-antigen ligase family protein [Actinomadura graeca]